MSAVRLRRVFWALLLSVAFVGVLFAGVFPTRTYLTQRASITRAEKQIHVLGQQNAELQRRAKDLQSNAEIERLARERYNLVKPGEEAYAVLPPPARQGDPPTAAPTPAKKHDDGNVLQRAWHAVSGFF